MLSRIRMRLPWQSDLHDPWRRTEMFNLHYRPWWPATYMYGQPDARETARTLMGRTDGNTGRVMPA